MLKECGIFHPRHPGWEVTFKDESGCLLPYEHSNKRGSAHLTQLKSGTFVEWKDDFECNCCIPEEDDRCTTYGVVSEEEAKKRMEKGN